MPRSCQRCSWNAVDGQTLCSKCRDHRANYNRLWKQRQPTKAELKKRIKELEGKVRQLEIMLGNYKLTE